MTENDNLPAVPGGGDVEIAAAPGDLEIAVATISERTVREAAAAAGVSESTVYRRLRDPEFRVLLKEVRYRAYSHALNRLQAATGVAVSALAEVAQDRGAPAGVRVKASIAVLELAARDLESDHLQERLDRDARARRDREREAAAAPYLGKDKEAYLRAGGDELVWRLNEMYGGNLS